APPPLCQPGEEAVEVVAREGAHVRDPERLTREPALALVDHEATFLERVMQLGVRAACGEAQRSDGVGAQRRGQDARQPEAREALAQLRRRGGVASDAAVHRLLKQL